jgi:hypothetical protein
MSFCKSKDPELYHDRHGNKWYLIPRWKKKGDSKVAVDPLDVSDSVNAVVGTMGDYVRRCENMVFLVVEKMLENEGLEKNDKNFTATLNKIDELANDASQRPYRLNIYRTLDNKCHLVREQTSTAKLQNVII